MPTKRYLMTPGPTPVPPQVLAAMAEPIVHHRSPDFTPVFVSCLERLGRVFRTERDVLVLSASGTGAFESAVVNLLSPGERVLSVTSGNFGERWTSMAKAYGADTQELRYAWGETPQPADLEARLEELGGASVVFLVHSETSTGVVSDVQALAAVAKRAGALVVVDAVSSLGGVPLETDAWGIDVVVTGSQKALMTPPGLGLVSVSEAAVEKSKGAALPRFYLDWGKALKAQGNKTSAFTPAVSLVAGLDVALGMLLDEGLDAVYDRHIRLGRAARAGAKAMGLQLFSPDEDRSAVVTAIRGPQGVDADAMRKIVRDRHGVTLAGGQGDLTGQIFRIGHIGWYDVFDITTALGAVELVLAELGADIERGRAAAAALEAFSA